MRINKKNKKLLHRIRFGTKKEDKLILLITIIGAIIFFSYGGYSGLINPTSEYNPFLTFLFGFIIKLLLISSFISIISYESEDAIFLKTWLIPFILAEPLFFFRFNWLFDNIKYINWTLISGIFSVGGIIAAIVLILFFNYKKKNDIMERIYSKGYKFSGYLLIVFLAMIITLFMQGENQINTRIIWVFLIKDIIMLSLMIFFFVLFIIKSKRLFLESINITNNKKPIKHGSIVYFSGKYNLLKEKTQTTANFLNYVYTKKMFLVQIENKKRKVNVLEPPNKNILINTSFSPGDNIEVFGKFIRLEINEKLIQFIYPFRINNLKFIRKEKK